VASRAPDVPRLIPTGRAFPEKRLSID
jgi:hypothetical protein